MHILRWSSLFLACGAVLVACAHNGQTLSDRAIRHFLPGKQLIPVIPPDVVVSHPTIEVFGADGSYDRRHRGMITSGSYTIIENSVCVRVQGADHGCRRVMALPDGSYMLINTSSGRATKVRAEPLRQ